MPCVLDGFGKVRVVAYAISRSTGSAISNTTIFKNLVDMEPRLKDICVSIWTDAAVGINDLVSAGLPNVTPLLCTWHMIHRCV